MRQRAKGILAAALALLLAPGCAQPVSDRELAPGPLYVVATTTMLADLSGVIGGEHVSVEGLMGPGVDPHLYQASAGDVALLRRSDVVVYNGLHLEGKMGQVFASLSKQGHTVVCIGEEMDQTALLARGEGAAYDPHVWFDVALWKEAAGIVAGGFSQADPGNALHYQANLKHYLARLDELDTYIRQRVGELPQQRRVLITAHDAFGYFGRAYGFEVRGIQGISTDAEAGTADLGALANFIVERQIKAVFVESSVPPKTVEALRAAVRARGFDLVVGGELYSDSLGGEESGADSYIGAFEANVDVIVDFLT